MNFFLSFFVVFGSPQKDTPSLCNSVLRKLQGELSPTITGEGTSVHAPLNQRTVFAPAKTARRTFTNNNW